MAEGDRKNWRELCSAALEMDDPDELLKILQELNNALKHEEHVRRDLREAMRANKSSGKIRLGVLPVDLSQRIAEVPKLSEPLNPNPRHQRDKKRPMNSGIIRKALTTTLALQLEYLEPSVHGEIGTESEVPTEPQHPERLMSLNSSWA